MTATAALETRAEIVKLARLLGRDEASLEYLEAAAADDLRALRIQATDVLFDADRAVLERLAAASRRLPAGLVATIGRRVFGPLLCARTAGILDPKHAIDLAGRLDTPFLADIAVELDPRRASDVIGGMPTRQIVAVAAELARRREYVAMGRFVGHLTDEALVGCVSVIDDEALLRIGFVLEGKERLDRITELAGEARLAGILEVAAAHDLWPEALDLLSHMAPERRARLVALAGRLDEAVLTTLDEMLG